MNENNLVPRQPLATSSVINWTPLPLVLAVAAGFGAYIVHQFAAGYAFVGQFKLARSALPPRRLEQ